MATVGVAQLDAWNGIGAMKSFSSDEIDSPEVRALTQIEPNDWHVS